LPREYEGPGPYDPREYDGYDPREYDGYDPREYDGYDPREYDGYDPREYDGYDPREYDGVDSLSAYGLRALSYDWPRESEKRPHESVGPRPSRRPSLGAETWPSRVSVAEVARSEPAGMPADLASPRASLKRPHDVEGAKSRVVSTWRDAAEPSRISLFSRIVAPLSPRMVGARFARSTGAAFSRDTGAFSL
jgi:hypothetical protein